MYSAKRTAVVYELVVVIVDVELALGAFEAAVIGAGAAACLRACVLRCTLKAGSACVIRGNDRKQTAQVAAYAPHVLRITSACPAGYKQAHAQLLDTATAMIGSAACLKPLARWRSATGLRLHLIRLGLGSQEIGP